MYCVDVFDGISGYGDSFDDLEQAKRYFDKERAYHAERGYKFEFIELYETNEDGEKIRTIEEING